MNRRLVVYFKPTDECRNSAMALRVLNEQGVRAAVETNVSLPEADLSILEKLKAEQLVGDHLPVLAVFDDDEPIAVLEEPNQGELIDFIVQHQLQQPLL